MTGRCTLRTYVLAVAGILLSSQAHSAEQCNEAATLNRCLALFDDATRLNPDSIKSCRAVAKLKCSPAPHSSSVARLTLKQNGSVLASVPKKPNPSANLPIYLGADILDNPYPGLTQSSPGQAVGASFGYTANNYVEKLVTTKSGSQIAISSTEAITTTGYASYVLLPPQAAIGSAEWVPSLWLSANGNWDHPAKAIGVGDFSALKFGPKIEFEVPNGVGPDPLWSFFDLAPFYQTDFYAKAQAAGLTVGWTPVLQDYFIGAENLSGPAAKKSPLRNFASGRRWY